MGKQGFASMDETKQKEISSKGGKKTRQMGAKPKGFAAMDKEKLREIAKKGGATKRKKKKKV